jgi:hypothetical protein
MGALAKALQSQSSYAAKKTPLWDEICDRIDGAMYPRQLEEVEWWLNCIELQVPRAWVEPIEELIEKRRIELRDEDIGNILRERYDF